MTAREAEIRRRQQEFQAASEAYRTFAHINWACIEVLCQAGEERVYHRAVMRAEEPVYFARVKAAAASLQAIFRDPRVFAEQDREVSNGARTASGVIPIGRAGGGCARGNGHGSGALAAYAQTGRAN